MQTYSFFGPTIYHSSEPPPPHDPAPITNFLSNILQYISSFLDFLSSDENVAEEAASRDPENSVIYIDDDSLLRSGLTPSQINEHTTIEYMEESSSDNFECSICQETVSTGVYRKLNICSHRFHIQCIDNWLDNHSTCPVCRQELLPGNSSSRLFRNILNQLRTTISSRTTTP